MRFHHVEGLVPDGEDVMASSPISMVVVQSLRSAERLNMVIEKSKKFVIANVLHAFCDFFHPLLKTIIVHLAP